MQRSKVLAICSFLLLQLAMVPVIMSDENGSADIDESQGTRAGMQNIVTGAGPGPDNPPLVRTSQAEWVAYGTPQYGVNVACGNIDGIGYDEVITGAGPGPELLSSQTYSTRERRGSETP